ncbi:MAG: hypothetical protein PHI41_02475 [Erysipelotrichaceae bacterium]|nr:hypothetical protein [Erysipelotrichaceae bacterium]
MYNKFTNREKILLAITAVLIVAVVYWYFMLSPQLTSRMDLANEKLILQSQVEQLEATVVTEDEALVMIEEVNTQLQEYLDKYQAVLLTEDIDKLLTSSVDKYQLKPASISISTPEEILATTQTDTTQTDGTDDTQPESQSNTSSVYQVSITHSLTGTKANLENYVDYIRSLSGVQISTMTMTSAKEGGGQSIAITYVLSMVEA